MNEDRRFKIELFVTAAREYDVVDFADGLAKLQHFSAIAAVQTYLVKRGVDGDQVAQAIRELTRGTNAVVFTPKQ
jgi:hypothetical protein